MERPQRPENKKGQRFSDIFGVKRRLISTKMSQIRCFDRQMALCNSLFWNFGLESSIFFSITMCCPFASLFLSHVPSLHFCSHRMSPLEALPLLNRPLNRRKRKNWIRVNGKPFFSQRILPSKPEMSGFLRKEIVIYLLFYSKNWSALHTTR